MGLIVVCNGQHMLIVMVVISIHNAPVIQILAFANVYQVKVDQHAESVCCDLFF
jgi:hypothetical protein